jgi:hypothetical protein
LRSLSSEGRQQARWRDHVDDVAPIGKRQLPDVFGECLAGGAPRDVARPPGRSSQVDGKLLQEITAVGCVPRLQVPALHTRKRAHGGTGAADEDLEFRQASTPV